MPRILAETELQAESFLAGIDWLSPEKLTQKATKTPIIQRIQRPTSARTVKPILAKRAFEFEFSEVEDSPLKLRKSTKKSSNLQKSVFSAGLNSPHGAIQIGDIQKAIQEALTPLIVEVQQLKIEISSLKKENSEFSSQMTRNQANILKKNEKLAQTNPLPASNTVEKALQRTAKETYAEIAKINSLMTKQSDKLDNWTLIQRRKPQNKETEPKNGLEAIDRRILFKREKTSQSVQIPDLLLAINKAIKDKGLPDHIRLLRLWETPSGAISGQLKERANVDMLNSTKTAILEAIQEIDPAITSFQAAEQWYTLKIHTISLNRHLNPQGMKALKDDIEATTGLDLPILPRWLNEQRALERFEKDEIAYSTAVIKVRSKAIADKCIAKGIDFSGKNHKVELFLEARPDIICRKCTQFGHNSYNACQEPPKCAICGGKHEIKDHKCAIKGCTALTGTKCSHIALKCVNCDGPHLANFSYCSKRLEWLDKQRLVKKELYSLQKSRQKIAVMIPIKATSSGITEDMEIEPTPLNTQEC